MNSQHFLDYFRLYTHTFCFWTTWLLPLAVTGIGHEIPCSSSLVIEMCKLGTSKKVLQSLSLNSLVGT